MHPSALLAAAFLLLSSTATARFEVNSRGIQSIPLTQGEGHMVCPKPGRTLSDAGLSVPPSNSTSAFMKNCQVVNLTSKQVASLQKNQYIRSVSKLDAARSQGYSVDNSGKVAATQSSEKEIKGGRSAKDILGQLRGLIQDSAEKNFSKKELAWIMDKNNDLSKPLISTNGSTLTTRFAAPWSLRMLSNRYPSTGSPLYSYNYYTRATGKGISVYVVDTGIIRSTSFNDRIVDAPIFSNDTIRGSHGTTIASAIADPWAGACPECTIVDVKVMEWDGSGSVTNIVRGLEWIYNHAVVGKSVINLSLSTPRNAFLDDAVATLFAKGIPIFAAAGNFADDACKYSPSASPGVFSVAATNHRYYPMDFTNSGKCINAFGPGHFLPSAWGGNTWNFVSGSSSAVTYATSIAAMILSDPLVQDKSPSGVYLLMLRAATRHQIYRGPTLDGTETLLLHSQYMSDGDGKSHSPVPPPKKWF
ncbi:MAG: peptidase S8/S53 domain-containing protein [Piptocephalis tieghemiana]|nr:MAG: peptidase S8/S53 domain-containing protein [Piptocephalis tieghemiana]